MSVAEVRAARRDARLAEFCRRLPTGTAQARRLDVVICALARDLGPLAAELPGRIEAIGGLFRSWQAVVYENDSTDGTAGALDAWRAPGAHVVHGHKGPGWPRHGHDLGAYRLRQMAWYRAHVRELSLRLPPAEVYLVMDTDFDGPPFLGGILHSLSHWGEWDAIFGFDARSSFPHWIGDLFAYESTPDNRGRRYPQEFGAPLIPVLSAFGGIGLYTRAAWLAGDYEAERPPRHFEHLAFHDSMIRAGRNRLFLNPSMVTLPSAQLNAPVAP